jgi:DNA-binding GntR family transcriptional regulator
MSTTLSAVAYRHIQSRLLRASLRAGAKISEHRLARELGISRTPVREALRRLESEGMLRRVASSGTFVAEPDRAQLIEAYEVRMALEAFAVKRAALRMLPRQVHELQQLCDEMRAAVTAFRNSGAAIMEGAPLRRYLLADLAFHLLLLRAAGNRYALKILCDVHIRSAIFGYRSHQRDLHHLAYVWLDHARVARAVRQRDAAAAQRCLEKHMQASLEAALAAFDARRPDERVAPPPADLAKAMEALIAEVGQGGAPRQHARQFSAKGSLS